MTAAACGFYKAYVLCAFASTSATLTTVQVWQSREFILWGPEFYIRDIQKKTSEFASWEDIVSLRLTTIRCCLCRPVIRSPLPSAAAQPRILLDVNQRHNITLSTDTLLSYMFRLEYQ